MAECRAEVCRALPTPLGTGTALSGAGGARGVVVLGIERAEPYRPFRAGKWATLKGICPLLWGRRRGDLQAGASPADCSFLFIFFLSSLKLSEVWGG